MQHTLHLLKSQLREHRICILAILFILFTLIVIPTLSLEHGTAHDICKLSTYALIIAILILLNQLVHSQPFSGTESFWMSRPVSPRSLIAAQLSLLTLVIALPSLLGILYHTYTVQGEATHYLQSIKAWSTRIGVLYVAYAIAVATKSFTGLITLTGACALTYSLLLASLTHDESPLPRIYREDLAVIAPAFGCLAVFTTLILVRKLRSLRIILICFSILAPFMYSLLQVTGTTTQPQKAAITPPQFEIRPQPEATLDTGSSSFSLNIQVPHRADQLIFPYSFRITTKDNNNYSRHIGHKDYDLQQSALVADRFMDYFPPETNFSSLENLSLDQLQDESTTYTQILSSDKNGQYWKQTQVDSFILTEAESAEVEYCVESLEHFDALPLREHQSITSNGTKIEILDIIETDYGQRVRLSFNYAAEPRIPYLSDRRECYPALYTESQQSLTLLRPISYRGDEIAPSLLCNTYNEIRIPHRLIAQDSQLYFILLKRITDNTGADTHAQAIPGTYQ